MPRRVEGGKASKFILDIGHASNSVARSSGTSSWSTPSSRFQLPSIFARSIAAIPAGITSPISRSRSRRPLFTFDHPLPAFRGVQRSALRESSIRAGRESIQPKHKHSSLMSTADTWSSLGPRALFFVVTTHTPDDLTCSRYSHRRHESLVGASTNGRSGFSFDPPTTRPTIDQRISHASGRSRHHPQRARCQSGSHRSCRSTFLPQPTPCRTATNPDLQTREVECCDQRGARHRWHWKPVSFLHRLPAIRKALRSLCDPDH